MRALASPPPLTLPPIAPWRAPILPQKLPQEMHQRQPADGAGADPPGRRRGDRHQAGQHR
jgi:hypothetical protein